MSYRKITVDGKKFDYVIGRTHTKVRGLQAVPNEKIGEFVKIDDLCECCGTPMSELYPYLPLREMLTVQPKHVAQWIKSVN